MQQIVFPNLARYCNSRGWQFEDVDLRWGINEEASLDQRTMQICLEELRACQAMSPRPNFLILQGDRYGWIPLPEILTKEQGEQILSSANDRERTLFNQWYKLDTNHNVSVGGSWTLQPRGGVFTDWDYYKKTVETPLRVLFERHGEEWMNQSATEREIWAGAFSLPDSRNHVVLYDRYLKDVPGDNLQKYSEKWSLSSSSPYRRVQKLREHENKHIDHVLRKTLSLSELGTDDYEKWFAQGIESLLRDVIEKEINRYESVSDEELAKIRANEYITESHNKLIGRDEELKALSECTGGNFYYLSGPSGSGLSTLAAAFLKDKNAVFCSPGITHMSANGEDLLKSLWSRLGGADSGDSFSLRSVSNLLSRYDGDPVWVILDGLYHLDQKDEAYRELWRPNALSGKVTLIITGDYEILLSLNLIPAEKVVTIHPFSAVEAEHFLLSDLSLSDVGVTAEQRQFILSQLSSNSELFPRYLTLLCADINRWHSYDKEWPVTFAGDYSLILEQVSRSHGNHLTSVTFELLSSTLFGISALEWRLFLMQDKGFSDEFIRLSRHSFHGELAPSILYTRFFRDLSPFIHQASAFDTFLSRIDDSQFRDVIAKSFDGFGQKVFDFYNTRWRNGDTHALSEIGYIAGHINDVDAAYGLFSDLEYCIAKLSHGFSSRLRGQMSEFREKCPAILDFILFDIDADSYCGEHKELDARTAVMHLAAAWREGSAIRNAYNSLSEEDTLINTLGWRSYRTNLFATVPGEPDDTAFPTENGLVLWLQDERLMCADTEKGEVKELSGGQQFQYIGNGRCILYNGQFFSLLDIQPYPHKVNDAFKRRYDGVKAFIGFHDSNAYNHVAFIIDNTLYWITARDSVFAVEKSEEYTLHLGAQWKWEVEGFLFDGKSLILQALVFEGDVQTKVQVMKVDRCGDSLSFDDNGSFISVADCQHTMYSAYQSLFPTVTTDGANHVSTIHFKYDSKYEEYAFCMTYLVTYTETGINCRDLDLSACTLSRGWTYYLHLSSDGETLLHCSLDTRLVKYNLKHNKIESVLHLPSEGISLHASPNNAFVLFDNREYHRDYKKKYLPLYNRLLRYSHLSTADDYFDSGLTTLSADSRAILIMTSFGNFYGVCAESAKAYIWKEDDVVRMSTPKEETWSYSTAVAVTPDCNKYAFALGAGDYDSPKYWDYVIRDNDGHVYPTDGNVSMMQYAPDGYSLFALVSHLSPTVRHQFLIIKDGVVERIDLHRMDAKDATLCRGKYVSFKVSPNGHHVLYCSDRYGHFSLGILDLTSKTAKEVANDVDDFWWFADSASFCFTLQTNGHTVIHSLGSGKIQESIETAMAVNPLGCQLVYKKGDDGIYLGAEEIHVGEPIEHVLFCHDGIHCFIVSENVVFLVNWKSSSVVQRFYLSYPDDISRKYFSSVWVVDSSPKQKQRRFWHHMRLYDKGLLLSDWDTLFRLEPEKNYRINEEVFTTIHSDGTYMCPLCGHQHRASMELVYKIQSISKSRRCFELPESEWEHSFLREYKCEGCGVRLRFNPFVI